LIFWFFCIKAKEQILLLHKQYVKTMTATIRRATLADCPRMMELVKELALYERAPDQVTVAMEHFEHSGFGPHPVWWAFVAEENGVVQGFALYYIRYSTWKGQRMYLEDILVTEQARGRGLGALLMNALIQEAKNKGFTGITWQVLEWNEPAFNFYRKFNATLDPEWVNATIEL
jgi:GNAT superfamily N-acetyltransferase